ncbi:MAG: hypothetical protein H7Y31_02160 [Chitinophagaceae bacterium]|nr:hypothetical protein [Chitinophagaceae bacterium]
MKTIFTFLVFALTCASSFGQAYEAKAEHQRKQHVAAVLELPYPPEVVEEAIKDYMAKKGYKISSSKGTYSFKGVKMDDRDTSNKDVHFQVERKSRKEKDVSLVHLIVSKANESLSDRVPEDRTGIEDGKAFLNRMTPAFEAYNLEAEIENQDKNIKKAEKKLDNLIDDQRDLERKIKNLEDKLAENKKAQVAQQAEIGNQKTIFDGLKGKRKI